LYHAIYQSGTINILHSLKFSVIAFILSESGFTGLKDFQDDVMFNPKIL